MQTYFGYFGHVWLQSPEMICIILLKTSMFLCMQKINFIIHFFLTMLYLKESCNLIGQQHFGLKIDLRPKNYARYVREVSITIIVFVIDYFQEKLTWQNFSKNPKKPYFCQFFNNRITYHCAKSQKNLKSHSWENWWRDTPKTSFCH